MYGAIAQLGERLTGSEKVAGSSPVGSTLSACSSVWTEHTPDKGGVVGSNPTRRIMEKDIWQYRSNLAGWVVISVSFAAWLAVHAPGKVRLCC